MPHSVFMAAVAPLLLYLGLGIVLAAPFRLLVAYCATVRGRSPVAWSFLTYVLGPFALIVAVLPTDPTGEIPAHPWQHTLGREALATLMTLIGLVAVVGGVMTVVGLGHPDRVVRPEPPAVVLPVVTPVSPVLPCPASDLSDRCVAARRLQALREQYR